MSMSTLTRSPGFRWRFLVWSCVLLVSIVLSGVEGIVFTAQAATSSTQTSSWRTFHDPVYGFSIQYPGSWTLVPERDGSHITLLNPATRSSMSPIVTTQEGTPAAVLKQALSVAGAKTLTIAGHEAVDSLTPYTPASQGQMKNQDTFLPGGPQQIRQVVLPVTNTAASTNVYLFRFTQLTDAKGKMSIAVQADQNTFETMLESFTLPVKVIATHGASTTPNTAGCDRICWADANWNFADYTATSTVSSGDWQPNYQCAEFVARAITQDGFVPGLNNGGVNGSFPASDDSSNGYGYGGYLAGNGSTYYLWNVGVTGTPGLSTYLLNNGLATNIGQNVSQAAPGDVVFFGSSGSYEHTMIIVSISGGNLILDGHNVAQYHAVSGTSGLDIYHLKGAPSGTGGGGTGTPATTHPSSVIVNYASGAQDLIAVGSDGRMWHNWADASGNWIGWNWWSNGTDFASVTPTLVKYNDGSMDMFAVGKDGRLWHNWASASGSWIGWNWWSNPNFTYMTTTLIKYNNGSMDLIAVDTNGRMWHNWASGKDDWIGWNWWSNSNLTNVPPALVKYNDGSMDLIAVGTDGRMWHNWASASGSWIGWNWWSNGTDFASVTPTLVTYNDGSMDMFAVGKDGRLWHNWASASGSWIGWNWWGNPNFTNVTPTLIKYNNGSIDLIVIGMDGRMWHNWASGKDDWIGWNWFSNAGFTNAAPTLVKYASGAYDLIEVGMDGRMWHNWASASGSWIGWNWWSNSTPFAS